MEDKEVASGLGRLESGHIWKLSQARPVSAGQEGLLLARPWSTSPPRVPVWVCWREQVFCGSEISWVSTLGVFPGLLWVLGRG